MKFLRNILKGPRIEIIAFILGFLGMVCALTVPKEFLVWHALPKPPEPVKEITGAQGQWVVVRTVSNKNFACKISGKKEYWMKANDILVDTSKPLCFMEDCPNKQTIQMKSSISHSEDFGEITAIYALRDNGIIYVRQTGSVRPAGYRWGVMTGALSALIVFISRQLLLVITFLFTKTTGKQSPGS